MKTINFKSKSIITTPEHDLIELHGRRRLLQECLQIVCVIQSRDKIVAPEYYRSSQWGNSSPKISMNPNKAGYSEKEEPKRQKNRVLTMKIIKIYDLQHFL